MKTFLSTTVFAVTMSLASATVTAEPETYVIDDEHFSMAFEVMHIGYAPVMGMFREVEGRFEYDEDEKQLVSGKLTFKSKSVFTNHDKRDDHLREDDFLDSGNFPDILFEVTGFESTGDNSGVVTGDLTLLGQTRPVDVNVTLNKSADYPIGHKDYTLGITADTTINRSEWGMDYGIEEGLVGDEVRLRFGLEAVRDSGWL